MYILMSGDKDGVIHKWHNEVTKKNLDLLIPLLKQVSESTPSRGNEPLCEGFFVNVCARDARMCKCAYATVYNSTRKTHGD